MRVLCSSRGPVFPQGEGSDSDSDDDDDYDSDEDSDFDAVEAGKIEELPSSDEDEQDENAASQAAAAAAAAKKGEKKKKKGDKKRGATESDEPAVKQAKKAKKTSGEDVLAAMYAKQEVVLARGLTPPFFWAALFNFFLCHPALLPFFDILPAYIHLRSSRGQSRCAPPRPTQSAQRTQGTCSLCALVVLEACCRTQRLGGQ